MPWLIKILLLLIPFISLYVSHEIIFPFVVGKNLAFRILTELALVLWLGCIIIHKKYRPQSSLMLRLVLGFTAIIGLANLLGVNSYRSFWSTFERMDGYITILHLCAYFILIQSMFKTKKDWLFLLNSFTLVGLILTWYVIWEKAGIVGYLPRDGRPVGTLGNPSYIASYCILAITVKMIVINLIKRIWLRLPYFILIWLDLWVIYLSATRGAILGLMGGILAFCLMVIYMKTSRKLERVVWHVALVSLIIFLLSPSIILILKDTSLIKENHTLSRLSQISLDDTTAKVRLMTWKMALQGIKERPILGWGQENFVNVSSKFFNPNLMAIETWVDRPHNAAIQWAVSAGIIGLLSYLSLFGALFWKLRMPTKIGTFAVLSGIIAYLIQNAFMFDSINTYIVFFAILAYVNDNIQTKTDS